MAAIFIDDGYTFTDTIERNGNKLTFSARPMVGALRQQIVNAQIALRDQGLKGITAAARMTEEAIANQLISWDALDAEGKPLPVTPENVRRIHPMDFPMLELKVMFWREEITTEKN